MANFRTLGTDFTAGLRAPHYTNGRLLTAEDLQQEQRTELARLAQLGQAAGYGIVEGFDVTAAAGGTALRVGAGLGLNRKGQIVHLAAAGSEGSLTLPVNPVASAEPTGCRSGRFEACTGAEGEPAPITAAGAYLLTAAPLARLEGFVPRKACDGTGTSTCANQWEIEGVEFKIILLPEYQPPTGSRVNRNRNLLAHWFYGSDEIVTLMRDPLHFDDSYTGFDRIAAADFTSCDLPLAVFFWSGRQIAFVDQWAVRRRLVHPYPAPKWGANLSDQRQAEGQARFLQFQQQVVDLQAASGPQTDTLRAIDHFGYLPPVGILPVNPFELIVADVFDAALSERQKVLIQRMGFTVAQVLERVRDGVLNSLGDSSAYSLDHFFGNLLPRQYSIVHEDYVHDRLHQSWVQPPIALPPPLSPNLGLFEVGLADGTLVAVNEANFDIILDNLNSKFKGSIFSYAAAAVAPAAPAAAKLKSANAAAPGAIPDALLTAGSLNLHTIGSVFRRPRDIFIPPLLADYEAVDPLVDILVVDELLDPYREQLAQTMSGRIDDAITALASGGIFTGINAYTAVNKAIANAFTLNKFLWRGALAGKVDYGQLIRLISRGTSPTFYVVFVRHRPPAASRPLRL